MASLDERVVEVMATSPLRSGFARVRNRLESGEVVDGRIATERSAEATNSRLVRLFDAATPHDGEVPRTAGERCDGHLAG
jgi:hypothetical protein